MPTEQANAARLANLEKARARAAELRQQKLQQSMQLGDYQMKEEEEEKKEIVTNVNDVVEPANIEDEQPPKITKQHAIQDKKIVSFNFDDEEHKAYVKDEIKRHFDEYNQTSIANIKTSEASEAKNSTESEEDILTTPLKTKRKSKKNKKKVKYIVESSSDSSSSSTSEEEIFVRRKRSGKRIEKDTERLENITHRTQGIGNPFYNSYDQSYLRLTRGF